MDQNYMLALQEKRLMTTLTHNTAGEHFGLVITNEDALEIVAARRDTLKTYNRFEFGKPIIEQIIFEFCDSQFINQRNYTDSLMRLQDIFFEFKNEMDDLATDDELLHMMRELYEEVCFGDLDYLEFTCLPIIAEEIFDGYIGHHANDGYGCFKDFDIVTRWDQNLYMDALSNLF